MEPQYTTNEMYDLLANQASPADLLAQDADEMAAQLAELIDSSDTRYPMDAGLVNLYAVVAAIKRVAATLAA